MLLLVLTRGKIPILQLSWIWRIQWQYTLIRWENPLLITHQYFLISFTLFHLTSTFIINFCSICFIHIILPVCLASCRLSFLCQEGTCSNMSRYPWVSSWPFENIWLNSVIIRFPPGPALCSLKSQEQSNNTVINLHRVIINTKVTSRSRKSK